MRGSRAARRFVLCALVLLLLLPLLTVAFAWLRVLLDSTAISSSVGTPGKGRLIHGHVIPPAGKGFATYSYLGAALGRQYVHGAVRDALLSALAAQAEEPPLVIGETGHRQGGRFWPHKSHQNGLSVDVSVPVLDEDGQRARLSTWPWNSFGYGLEFDGKGQLGGVRIDFDRLARLLLALERSCARSGLRITRIILLPELVPLLLQSPSGQRLGSLAQRLTRDPVWVRHDEHIHVDFELTSAAGRAPQGSLAPAARAR